MRWVIAIALVIGLPSLIIIYNYGTLNPCGIVRAQIRQEAARSGGFGGVVVSILSDTIIDGIVTDIIGPLSPGRCLAVAFEGAPQHSPIRQQSPKPSPTQPLANQQSIVAPRGSPEALRQAGIQANDAIKECRSRRLNGQLISYAASAQCSGPRIYEAYGRAGYRHMDLVAQLAAKRLELAQSMDLGKLTEVQAALELSKFDTLLTNEERQRDMGKR